MREEEKSCNLESWILEDMIGIYTITYLLYWQFVEWDPWDLLRSHKRF